MEDGMATLPALLERNSKLYGKKEAFREKQFGIWQTWSWTEVYEEVNKLSLGLISLGVKEGDHICVIGRNRPQLYWSILAAQNVGAIPTPLYQDSVADEMVYPITHCKATFAIVEDQEQVDKLIEVSDHKYLILLLAIIVCIKNLKKQLPVDFTHRTRWRKLDFKITLLYFKCILI